MQDDVTMEKDRQSSVRVAHEHYEVAMAKINEFVAEAKNDRRQRVQTGNPTEPVNEPRIRIMEPFFQAVFPDTDEDLQPL